MGGREGREISLAAALGYASGIVVLVAAIASAIMLFETKVDHRTDMDNQKELFRAIIKAAANDAADAAVEKWINRRR